MESGNGGGPKVLETVLIIGGGVAGMTAAMTLSDLGYRVHLVERTDHLGGRMAELGVIFPSMEEGSQMLGRLTEGLRGRSRVVIHLSSEIAEFVGSEGKFEVTIRAIEGARTAERFEAGAVILATGMDTVDAAGIPELGYGRLSDVITSMDLEAMLDLNGVTRGNLQRPSNGKGVSRVVFIQCVGSRVEKRGVPYCSHVCCAVSVKDALEIKARCPSCEVHVLYIDMRMQGRGQEAMYKEAKKMGIKFIRGQPAMVVSSRSRNELVVQGENTLLNELYELPADLVVLGVGLRHRSSNAPLFRKLGVALSEEGLPSIADGSEDGLTAAPGVFLAGCVEAPKNIRESILQAEAAAAKVASLLMSRRIRAP
jgi:heterodisulfide reductase subunit A2